MTYCVQGGHDFPYEDETGAYCAEHGVTLLRHKEPSTEDERSGDNSPHRQSAPFSPHDRWTGPPRHSET
ncbi:hypothetical protein GCM10009654_27150 [Streptomyces hebeiensis]|uniref:Uncharacterized protein n=1 Tax=Streptomyces hebeiensis TaxID=229486 RepID=A0ABN1UUC0_9ACTN